jgi:23S rRNA (uridine2552-2'-O)-methyltransferase
VGVPDGAAFSAIPRHRARRDGRAVTKRTKSSRRWLDEHESDIYVKRARESGFRSRAAFKLEEIQRSDRIIKPGMTIVDLGAAPGGWSQLAARLLHGKGRIIALDVLPMDEIHGVEFIQGDFSSDEVLAALEARLGGDRPQLVMSDMAPNMMGIADVDHDRSMHLVELALDFALRTLPPGGDFLVKVFQGRHFQPFVKQLRSLFATVKVRKPPASRQRSSELYLLARDFKS